MKRLVVVVLTFGLAACATHAVNLSDGTEKPARDDAIIRVWSPGYNGNVSVLKVDGIERGARTSHVYVRPGDHQLTVTYLAVRGPRIFRSRAPAQLDVTTKAGHTYVVNVLPDFENEKVGYQVEDKGTQYDPSCLIPRPFAPGALEGKNC